MKLSVTWKAALVLLSCVVLYSGEILGQAPAMEFSSSVSGLESGGGSTAAGAVVDGPALTPFHRASAKLPFEYGVVIQGGLGLTENRNDFKFIMAGVHAGKVLYRRDKPGLLQGDFEYAVELFPYWQSFTPKFQRANCLAGPAGGGITCSPYYTVGGTFSGASVTPIILRWNLASHGRIVPWVQGAGGLLWTNHKYPAFGSPTLNLTNDGPNTDASVWNFTPQGGVGFHYFVSPERSIDFGANAVHISSASLGDKNPGVNASVQFSIGYSFWK
jgi:hypothetical protein